ncbi:zinc-dependent metalloprotease [Acidiferrimicrobium sp. IK]|uniref:zinc-dependent metalloprotease n=1 Tax=Acidiferrimicrobium sp. IK TaxID=2871700 RepID=UPI0021CB4296|nr:zinc-dependent metalloprotease [Acidiferrimicrobium sp. IK]MCU4186989.1 zinc-dependent metalloprotease [Acidiferrimicrobium sp. IK]
MVDPVDWGVAAQVAARVAGRHAPYPAFEIRALEADFAELTAEAEGLVAEETGLRSLAGPARARVTDRAGWVEANVASFQRLLGPVTAKLGESLERSSARPFSLPVGASRRVSGTQVGMLLGWMSSRVLGQYDQLLIEDEDTEDQDIVYYVGPNILGLERRFGFPPREFRLWLALHEVTHRAQFTGVPWMRGHFLGLVQRTLDGVDPDPRRLLDALRRSASELKAGRNPLDEGGLLTLLATPEQHATIQEVGGLMSLLEGHGDITMDRAAAERIPNAARFAQTLRERRRQRGVSKVVTTLIGLDAKLRQYEQGEAFIEAVEAVGGEQLLRRVWDGPEWLPSWPEIRDPAIWVERCRAAAPAAG